MAENSNVFALLGDDENEDPQILAAKAPKLVKKDAVAEKAEPAKTVKQEVPRADAGRGGRGGRGREGRGGRGGRGSRPFVDRNAGTEGEAPVQERTEGEGGRVRGGRRGGRGGRFSGEGRPPRREYERHDGTGRGHETEKRHGSGRGNWGKEGDEVKESPVVEEAQPAVEEVVPEGAPDVVPATEEPPKEDEKELSLEEYEAMLLEKKKVLNRSAESKNVDPTSELKGLKAFTKQSTEEKGLDLATVEKKKAEAERIAKEAAAAKAKAHMTIETGFRIERSDVVRERGGRGARGGRGGRFGDQSQSGRAERGGRGGERSGRGGERGASRGAGRGAAPAMDESHFPALA